MKLVSLLTTAAALAALLVLPVRLEISGTLLFAAGLAAIMHQDYRARRMLKLPSRRGRTGRAVFRAAALTAEPHRLAA